MKLINVFMKICFFLNSRIFTSKIVGQMNNRFFFSNSNRYLQISKKNGDNNKDDVLPHFPLLRYTPLRIEDAQSNCSNPFISATKRGILNENWCKKENNNDIVLLHFSQKWNNDFINDKKLISISPGGLKGFYILGVLTYIKENYKLDEFIFSGASAGAWNSLFMCYKKNPKELVLKILNSNLIKAKSVHDMQYSLKYKILELCKDEDFDLKRLFIGVTSLQKYKMVTHIFSNFDNLEDAINCCIASSHIPLVTGGFTNKYHNMYTFDGGFSNYPYLNTMKPTLHVNPSMWKEMKNSNVTQMFLYNRFKRLTSFYQLVSENKQSFNFMKLYDDGYYDAKINKKILDEILIDDYSEI